MEYEYPNMLKESLSDDSAFKEQAKKAILKLYESKDDFHFKSKFGNAKLFADKSHKIQYLVLHQKNSLYVYLEPIYEWTTNPFRYAKDSLNQNGKLFSNPVIVVDVVGTFKESLGSLFSSDFASTSSAYELKNFFNFLNEGSFSDVNYDDNFWLKHSAQINSLVQPNVIDLATCIYYLEKACVDGDFNKDNKYEFNDMDNYVWIQDDKLCFSSQNVGFAVVRDKKGFTVLAADQESGTAKKYTEVEELLEAAKRGINLIDCAALKVEDGKVVYADNVLLYVMSLDLLFSKESMSEEARDKNKSKLR